MTDSTKTVHVRDITLGVLILVMSLFLYYAMWALTDYINLGNLMLLLICGWFARFLLRISYAFIRGVDVDIS